MAEFFLELFSEEIPAKLQVSARKEFKEILRNFFNENDILIKENFNIFSTPNRFAVHINKLPKEIVRKPDEIRGPNTQAPDKALEGFINSNNIVKSQIYKKKTEKGEFFFTIKHLKK